MKSIKLIIACFFMLYKTASSQDFIEQLKSYDKSEAEQIFRDSIWMKKEFNNKKIWEIAGLNSIEDAKNVKIIIIPVVYYKEDLPYGKSSGSIINFIEIRYDKIAALVIESDSVMELINVFKNCEKLNETGKTRYHRHEEQKRSKSSCKHYSIDSISSQGDYFITDYLIQHDSLLPTWVYDTDHSTLLNTFHYNTEFSNFLKSFYYVIKEENLTNYFIFSYRQTELWFYEDGKLRAYSFYHNNIFDEVDLIKGVYRSKIDPEAKRSPIGPEIFLDYYTDFDFEYDESE